MIVGSLNTGVISLETAAFSRQLKAVALRKRGASLETSSLSRHIKAMSG
jgi:hypothetical protein